MIAAARSANVFLMTAYRLHNEPGTVAVLEHIRANAIGRPLLFQSVFSFQTTLGNHRLNATTWGGPLQDIGVYCVNAARHIFAEEPTEAMAMAHRPADDPRFPEVDASLSALLRFPSGGLAQFVASFGAAAVDNYRVVGSLGDLELDPGFQFETATKLRLRRDGKLSETQFPQIDHFGAQVAYFSDCIATGTPPEADGEEGLADMRALIAIEKACLTGRPQTISSPPRWRHPTADMVRLRHRRIGASSCNARGRRLEGAQQTPRRIYRLSAVDHAVDRGWISRPAPTAQSRWHTWNGPGKANR